MTNRAEFASHPTHPMWPHARVAVRTLALLASLVTSGALMAGTVAMFQSQADPPGVSYATPSGSTPIGPFALREPYIEKHG
jgi:hypothetical protein